MTRTTLYKEDPKKVRDTLKKARELADQMHLLEDELITLLRYIDCNRYYVRIGLNSLRGFCVKWLLFSKSQGQRIATRVRYPPTPPDDGQLRASKASKELTDLTSISFADFARLITPQFQPQFRPQSRVEKLP